MALSARRSVSMCRNQPPSVPPASPLAVEYRVDYPPCKGCASFRLIKVAKQLSLSPCVLFDEAVQVVTRPTPVRERLDTFRLEHPSKCDCLAEFIHNTPTLLSSALDSIVRSFRHAARSLASCFSSGVCPRHEDLCSQTCGSVKGLIDR